MQEFKHVNAKSFAESSKELAEGTKLSAYCAKALRSAEQKILKLTEPPAQAAEQASAEPPAEEDGGAPEQTALTD